MKRLADASTKPDERLRTIELLGEVRPAAALPALLAAAKDGPLAARRAALAALAGFDDPATGDAILSIYPTLPAGRGAGSLRATALDTLAGRPAWAAALLRAVRAGAVPKDDLPPDLRTRLRASDDPAVVALTAEVFGPVAKPSSEATRKEIERVKRAVLAAPGDAAAGKALFAARCASCHALFGEGGTIGPDLTGSERDNLHDMVLNVVDPGAAVREEFTNFAVRTKGGRTIVGLVVERDAGRITLADAAGRRTVVARADVEREKALATSPMPEGLIADLSDAQLRDFFTYLTLRK